MSEKRIVLAIKVLIYSSFFTPLLVMGDTFVFPFVFPKAIFFRILVEIMFGLYLILCFVNKEYRPKKTSLLLVLYSLFFVLFLSSVFGVDFQRSFWGNHERMSGWFTLIHFGAYFAVLANVLRSWPEWRRLLRWSLAISLAVGLTGLNFLLPENSIMRIGSGGTLGNQIYLANFVLFHIFIAWFLFRKEESGGWKIFAGAIGLVEILIMVYNGKRGPFLGLLTGLFVGILLYALLSKVKKWRLVGLGLIGISLIFAVVVFANRQDAWVQKIPMVGRLAGISFQSGTGETRAIAWEIAYKAWKEKPIFGWGVENYYYAFNKHYNPKSLEHGYYETWFDRSHNIFLDYLSTSGVLGFLGYLAVFGAVFYLLGRSFRAGRIDLDRLVFLAMFFVGYALQNFFVFDHLSSYLTFFLILAFTNNSVFGFQSPPLGVLNKKQNRPPFGWSAIVIFAILFLVYKTNIQPALANNRSLESQKLFSQDFSAGLEKIKKAITNTPHLNDIRLDFGRAIASYAQLPEALKSEIYQQAVDYAVDELTKTIRSSPLEINAFLTLGQLYVVKGDLVKAEEIFTAAQKLSPKRQQVAYLLIKTKAGRRDYQGAVETLQKTIAENDKIADSFWYLSLIYYDLSEKEKAYENLKLALEKGKSFGHEGEMIFVGDLFKTFGDYENSSKYYELALGKQSSNPRLLLSLSENYALLGDKKKAGEMLDRAMLHDPQARDKAKEWMK